MRGKAVARVLAAGLCAVVTWPALVKAAPGAITFPAPAVVVSPATVESVAQYAVTFTLGGVPGGGLAEDVGQLLITFPTEVRLPAALPATGVLVNGGAGLVATSATGVGGPPAPPTINGHTVVITTPTAVANNATVTVLFTQAAGISNPTTAGSTFRISVATTAEAAVASPAYAVTPTLALTPERGARGAQVAVSGKGYLPGSSVDVAFAGLGVIVTGVADSSGTFSGQVTIPGNAPVGGGNLVATDGAGSSSGNVAFTVTPSLVLTPATGLPGSFVQLTGANWPPLTGVTGSVGGVLAGVTAGPGGPAATTSLSGDLPNVVGTGAAANTVLQIPNGSASGVKEIVISAGAVSASASFQVTARPLTVFPGLGVPGVQVTITASGMTPNGEIDPNGVVPAVAGANGTFLIDGVNWLSAGQGVAISSEGTLSVSLTIGAANAGGVPTTASPGAHLISVTDSGGRVASGTFTLEPRTLGLTPQRGPARSSVTVTGTGFPLNSSVALTWGNVDAIPSAWGRASADSSGSFTFTAPNLSSASASDVDVVVSASAPTPAGAIAAASRTFTVPGARLALSPPRAVPGETVTIAGSGFSPLVSINAITIGGMPVVLAGARAVDALGNFSVVALVPALPIGATPVATTLNVTGAPAVTATLAIIAAPPPIASSLSPLLDSNGVNHNLVRVWAYDASRGVFLLYDPILPGASDLRALTVGQGYWVRVKQSGRIRLGSGEYELVAGWNLIGWLG